MAEHPIAAWHRLVMDRNPAGLGSLLDDAAVFHSPVVHSPQKGRKLVAMYLSGALEVLGNESFRYVREVVGDRDAVLEFEVELDGILVNGVDIIKWNDAGRIVDFKVMLRPLKAVNLVHERMAAMLKASGG